jgi:hypothetical protein
VRERPDEQCRKFGINPKNYRIFPSNPKTDGMKVQSYSDRFPQHHIPFSYRLPYLSNNTKITRKYGKTEPKFSGILPTIFTLTTDTKNEYFLCLTLNTTGTNNECKILECAARGVIVSWTEKIEKQERIVILISSVLSRHPYLLGSRSHPPRLSLLISSMMALLSCSALSFSVCRDTFHRSTST